MQQQGRPGRNIARLCRSAAVLSALIVLSACAANSKLTEAGIGQPVSVAGFPTTADPSFDTTGLSAGIARAEELYRQEAVPLALAISADGDYAAWWRCTGAARCTGDVETTVRKLMSHCEQQDLGNRCYLHMTGETVLNPGVTYGNLPGYKVVPVAETAIHGPEKAKGLIIYLPGYGGWNTMPRIWPRLDNDAGMPLLEVLNDRGWDVRRINFKAFDRAYLSRRNDLWAEIIRQEISGARSQGYSRVVLQGHSRGGAEILRVLAAGVLPDAAMVTEPDWVGPKYRRDGKLNISDEKRLLRYGDMLFERSEAPLLYFHFARSRWFGGIGKDAIQPMLDLKDAPGTAIEQPDGFTSHYGVFTAAFARYYADCVERFYAGDANGDTCREVRMQHAEERDWTLEEHLKAGKVPAIGGEALRDMMLGKVFCIEDRHKGRVREDWVCARLTADYWERDSSVMARKAMHNLAPYDIRDDGFCRYDFRALDYPSCYRTYAEGNTLWLVDDKTESIFFKLVTDPSFTLKPADYRCTTDRTESEASCVATAGS